MLECPRRSFTASRRAFGDHQRGSGVAQWSARGRGEHERRRVLGAGAQVLVELAGQRRWHRHRSPAVGLGISWRSPVAGVARVCDSARLQLYGVVMPCTRLREGLPGVVKSSAQPRDELWQVDDGCVGMPAAYDDPVLVYDTCACQLVDERRHAVQWDEAVIRTAKHQRLGIVWRSVGRHDLAEVVWTGEHYGLDIVLEGRVRDEARACRLAHHRDASGIDIGQRS